MRHAPPPARAPRAQMLLGSWPGSRLDRVLAKLTDWRVSGMRIVGTEPIPGGAARRGPAASAPAPSRTPSQHTRPRPNQLTATNTPPLPRTPAATYKKALRNGSSKTLPVLPSDHFGLLLELEPL